MRRKTERRFKALAQQLIEEQHARRELDERFQRLALRVRLLEDPDKAAAIAQAKAVLGEWPELQVIQYGRVVPPQAEGTQP